MTRLLSSTESAQKKFNELNLSTEEGILTFSRFSKIASEDMFKALNLLSSQMDELKKNPDVLKALFTQRQWSTIAPVLEAINGNVAEFIELNTTGHDAVEAFNTQLESMDNQLLQLKNNSDALFKDMQDNFKLLASGGVKATNKFIDSLDGVNSEVLTALLGIPLLTGAISIFGSALITLTKYMFTAKALTGSLTLATQPYVLALYGLVTGLSSLYIMYKKNERTIIIHKKEMQELKNETKEYTKETENLIDKTKEYKDTLDEFEKEPSKSYWESEIDYIDDVIGRSKKYQNILTELNALSKISYEPLSDLTLSYIQNNLSVIDKDIKKIKEISKGLEESKIFTFDFKGETYNTNVVYAFESKKRDLEKAVNEELVKQLENRKKLHKIIADDAFTTTESIDKTKETWEKIGNEVAKYGKVIAKIKKDAGLSNLQDEINFLGEDIYFQLEDYGLFEGWGENVSREAILASDGFTKFKDTIIELLKTQDNLARLPIETITGIDDILKGIAKEVPALSEEIVKAGEDIAAINLIEFLSTEDQIRVLDLLSKSTEDLTHEQINNILSAKEGIITTKEFVELMLKLSKSQKGIEDGGYFKAVKDLENVDLSKIFAQASRFGLDEIEELKTEKMDLSSLIIDEDELQKKLDNAEQATLDFIEKNKKYADTKDGVFIGFKSDDKSEKAYVNGLVAEYNNLIKSHSTIINMSEDSADAILRQLKIEDEINKIYTKRITIINNLKDDYINEVKSVQDLIFEYENLGKSEEEIRTAKLQRLQEEKNKIQENWVEQKGVYSNIYNTINDIKDLDTELVNKIEQGTELTEEEYKVLEDKLNLKKEDLDIAREMLEIMLKMFGLTGGKTQAEIDAENRAKKELAIRKEIYQTVLGTVNALTSGQTSAPSFNMDTLSGWLSGDKEISSSKGKAELFNFGVTQYSNIATQIASKEAANIQNKISVLEMQKSLLTDEEDIQQADKEILREQINLINAQAKAQATQSIMGGVTGGISSGVGVASTMAASSSAGIASMATPVGWAVAGAGLLSGLLGSSSAKKEAKQQEEMLRLQAETNRLLTIQNKNIAAIERYQEEGARFGTAYAKKDEGYAGSEGIINPLAKSGWEPYMNITSPDNGKTITFDFEYTQLLNFVDQYIQNFNDAFKDFSIDGVLQQGETLSNILDLEAIELFGDATVNELQRIQNYLIGLNLAREKYFKEWYGFEVQMSKDGLSVEYEYFKLREDLLNSYIDNATTSYSNLGKTIVDTFSTGYLNNYVKEVMGLDDILNDLETSFTDFIDAQVAGGKGFEYKTYERWDALLHPENAEAIGLTKDDYATTHNIITEIINSTSELASKQKDVNQYTQDYLNEWVRVGGKISDVSDLIGYGLYDSISSALDEDSYEDMFNSLGDAVGKTLTDSIKRQFIDVNFADEILALNQKLSSYVSQDSLNIAGIQSIGAEMQKMTIQAEQYRSKMNVVKDLMDFNSEVEYQSTENEITYSTGSTSTNHYNYYISNNATIQDSIGFSEDSANALFNMLTPYIEKYMDNRYT